MPRGWANPHDFDGVAVGDPRTEFIRREPGPTDHGFPLAGGWGDSRGCAPMVHSRFVSYGSEGSRNDTPMFVSNPHPFVVSANGNVAFVGETATEGRELVDWNGRTRRSARRI